MDFSRIADLEIGSLLPAEEGPFAQVGQLLVNMLGHILPISFYWLDTEGYIRGCNQKVATDLGYAKPTDIINKHSTDVVTPEAWKNSQQVMLDGQVLMREELHEFDQDSNPIYYLSLKSPLRDKQGQVVGLLGIAIDITEFKRQEALVQSEKAAKEQARLLQLLAATIGHELRSPLVGIKSGLKGLELFLPALLQAYELAKQQQLPIVPVHQNKIDALQGVIASLQRQANLASTSIELLVANISHGAINERDVVICSAQDCIERALQEFPFKAGQQELVIISIEKDFSFLANAHHMLFVLLNLIKNALYFIEAAQKGELLIRVTCDDSMGRIFVRDTSIGIDSDVLPHIFEPFYSQRFGGSGVGLTYCKAVIDSLGGTISCQAVKNEFTEFCLSLHKLPE